MFHKITQDDDGSTAIELDQEGIDYLVEGLMGLYEAEVGGVLSAPLLWTDPAPWWRFWNRTRDPVVGEFRLRRVG